MKLEKTKRINELGNFYACSRQQQGCNNLVNIDKEGILLDAGYKLIDCDNPVEPVYCLCAWCMSGLKWDD